MERIGKLTTIKRGLECIKGSTSEDCLLELLTRINYPIVSLTTNLLTSSKLKTNRSKKTVNDDSVRHRHTRANHRQRAARYSSARYRAICSRTRSIPFSSASGPFTRFASWWTLTGEIAAFVLSCSRKNRTHGAPFKSWTILRFERGGQLAFVHRSTIVGCLSVVYRKRGARRRLRVGAVYTF